MYLEHNNGAGASRSYVSGDVTYVDTLTGKTYRMASESDSPPALSALPASGTSSTSMVAATDDVDNKKKFKFSGGGGAGSAAGGKKGVSGVAVVLASMLVIVAVM